MCDAFVWPAVEYSVRLLDTTVGYDGWIRPLDKTVGYVFLGTRSVPTRG